MRWTAGIAWLFALGWTACERNAGEQDATDGPDGAPPAGDTACARYCNAANDVDGCERFEDCEATCEEAAELYGASCVAERDAVYECAVKDGLVCDGGHAVPAKGTCGYWLAALQECDICRSYCSRARNAGCEPADCMSDCEADRDLPGCWHYGFGIWDCLASEPVSCAGVDPAIPEACAYEAESSAHCIAKADLCRGACLAVAAAGSACTFDGQSACMTACDALLNQDSCANEFSDYAECVADMYSVSCLDGAVVTYCDRPTCLPPGADPFTGR